MDQSADTKVLITIAPSPARRWMGVLSLAALGLLTLRLTFEAEGMWRLVFLGVSIAALLAAERLRQATSDQLELTRHELRTGSGRVLTTVENVNLVERGAFAFKPSNGFLIRLHAPSGRGWAPGLWWQRGRLLGIGGVLPGGQTRAMAELLTAIKQGTLDALDSD